MALCVCVCVCVEATDASRLVCVVVETRKRPGTPRVLKEFVPLRGELSGLSRWTTARGSGDSERSRLEPTA